MSLSAEQSSAILQGVASADSVFYALGAGVLVVLAGMWGFNRVSELLGGRSGSSVADEDGLGDESIFNSEDAPRPYLSTRAEPEGWRD